MNALGKIIITFYTINSIKILNYYIKCLRISLVVLVSAVIGSLRPLTALWDEIFNCIFFSKQYN
jgi:hypothetical protein